LFGGAFVVVTVAQLSVLGLYLPPVFEKLPHTIISVPVQTAIWLLRAVGTFVVLVAVQVSLVQPGVGVAGVGDETGVEDGADVGVGVTVSVGVGVAVAVGVAAGVDVGIGVSVGVGLGVAGSLCQFGATSVVPGLFVRLTRLEPSGFIA
jgi:hypothetical protein